MSVPTVPKGVTAPLSTAVLPMRTDVTLVRAVSEVAAPVAGTDAGATRQAESPALYAASEAALDSTRQSHSFNVLNQVTPLMRGKCDGRTRYMSATQAALSPPTVPHAVSAMKTGLVTESAVTTEYAPENTLVNERHVEVEPPKL